MGRIIKFFNKYSKKYIMEKLRHILIIKQKKMNIYSMKVISCYPITIIILTNFFSYEVSKELKKYFNSKIINNLNNYLPPVKIKILKKKIIRFFLFYNNM